MEQHNDLMVISGLSAYLGGELTPAIIQTEDFSEKYEALLNTLDKLVSIKDQVNAAMKASCKEQYLATGEGKIANDKYTYTYVPGTTRETIDTKKLKAEDPDTYKRFVRVTSVAESFKVVKKDKKEN